MIAHNGKQVTIAMRNRKAINLIARNGKAMFGEFVNWQDAYIDAAAKAVILAEYGSVVWSDVRDYAKAHPQIVEFINQDPHLACSISPNSNKVRYIYPDTVGNYFDTDYNPTIAPTAEVLMRAKNNNDTDYWGNSQLEGSCYYANFSSTLSYYRYGKSTSQNTGVALPIGEWIQWSVGKEVRVNGELKYTCANDYTPNASQKTIRIFNSWRNYPASFDLARFGLRDGADLAKDFVPYRDPSTGEMELLDLVTATLATRVGTFTEVIEDKQ